MKKNFKASNYHCIGLTGYAGDRTNEAMHECHRFAEALGKSFGFPCELYGEIEPARELSWVDALAASKTTFDMAVTLLEDSFKRRVKPILITPRCATAIATLPKIISHFPNVIIIYFDAHGDLTTPITSKSGYLGGMPISAAMGEWDSGYGAGLKPNNLVHVGGRDMEPCEVEIIEREKILTLSKDEIESDLGALRSLVKNKPVFIHIDTDVFDPSEVTAEYAVECGLYRRHIDSILKVVHDEGNLVGVEITELSPTNEFERKNSYKSLFDALNTLNTVY